LYTITSKFTIDIDTSMSTGTQHLYRIPYTPSSLFSAVYLASLLLWLIGPSIVTRTRFGVRMITVSKCIFPVKLSRMNKSSAVAKMALRFCTSQTVKRWGWG